MRHTWLRFSISTSVGGFALLFLLFAQPVSAHGDTCIKTWDCLVPTPTLVAPTEGKVFSSPDNVIITGLSWNETKVDVYIDDVYNGRAVLRTDPSQIGNFFYRPSKQLTPGKHTMYIVARNLSELEWSPDSPEVNFTVSASKPAQPVFPVNEPPEPSVDEASTTTTTTTSEQSANSVLDRFFREQDRSNGTTTSSTIPFMETTFARGGLITIFVLAIAFLIFYMFKPKYEEPLPFDEDKKDGPPPPDDSKV